MTLNTAAPLIVVCAVFGGAIASQAEVHPIIEMDTGYFFGASVNGRWIKADQAARSVTAKTSYKVYSLTKQVGEITAGKPQSVDEPCPDTLMVSLSSKPRHGVIGLAGSWNALARRPAILDATQPVYVDAVRDFLKTRGIGDPKVRITRILGVDLEGDGEQEVLISATNYFTERNEVPMHAPRLGSYSVVILRRVVGGKLQTQVVAGEAYPKPDQSVAPNVYNIGAVLDLNGDGKLEVVVQSFYYEGGQTTIYRCERDRIEPVLSVECGA